MEGNEKVLAVAREDLFGYEKPSREFDGFLPANKFHRNIFNLTKENGQYLWRYGPEGIEENPEWKQIIPYVLFRHDRKYFMYARLKGDDRLVSKLSLGIGGHITPGDGMEGNKEILAGLGREWKEEVEYVPKGLLKPKLLGFLNLSETLVDKVHFGLVFLVDGEHPNIDIHPNEREHNQKVGLFEYNDLRNHFRRDLMEGWSRILVRDLLTQIS